MLLLHAPPSLTYVTTDIKFTFHTKCIIKNLEPLKYFLRLEMARSNQATILGQSKFITNLLHDVGLLHYKLATFLLIRGLHLSYDTGDLL